MKSPKTITTQLREGKTLLKAVRESEPELCGSAKYLAALECAHAQAVSAQTRKETLAASAREATSQMHAAFKQYQDAASSLRSFIVSMLGRRSEKLLRYGIRPVGRRSRPKGAVLS